MFGRDRKELAERIVQCLKEMSLVEAEKEVKDEIYEMGKRVDSLLTQEGRVKYDLEATQTFCCAVGDNNPIHRSKTYAKRMGFDDTIVPGTLLAGRAENLVTRLVLAVKEVFGQEFVIKKQGTGFKNPVYHDTYVDWDLEVEKKDDSLVLSFECATKGEVKFTVDFSLGRALEGKSSDLHGPIMAGRYCITKEQLDAYCASLGIEIGEHPYIPMNYVSSFVTSLLLEQSKAVDGMPTGLNLGTQYQFHRTAGLGDVHVDIFKKRDPRSGPLGYLYRFDAVCSQKHRDIVVGTIDVVAPKLLENI